MSSPIKQPCVEYVQEEAFTVDLCWCGPAQHSTPVGDVVGAEVFGSKLEAKAFRGMALNICTADRRRRAAGFVLFQEGARRCVGVNIVGSHLKTACGTTRVRQFKLDAQRIAEHDICASARSAAYADMQFILFQR
ncbi:hypothetical protein D1368_25325 [Klebsiella pneumoniae]|nr:hypothetical protein D1368_25325 [Klebsiella pneumoniae]